MSKFFNQLEMLSGRAVECCSYPTILILIGSCGLTLDAIRPFFAPLDAKAQSNLNVGLVFKLQIITENTKNQTQK